MSALTGTVYSRIVAVLAIIYVLFMYSGVVDFLPARTREIGTDIARVLIYGIFGLALGLAPVMLLNYRPAKLGPWGLIFVCYAAALFGVMCYHLIATPQEGGLVTKSFIIAILNIWTFGFLFGTTSAARVTQLTAMMVILANGLFILTEVVAPSLAAVPGRGSGFYLNPNVAASALVLGSLGALRFLAPLWRLPFLAFVGVAVFATLSRSGIIAAAATWTTWLAVEWTAIRNARQDCLHGASIAVVVIAAGGLILTLAASKEFREFAGKAAGPMIADDLVPATSPERPPTRHAAPYPRCESWTVVFEGLTKADACPWLRLERVKHVEKYSTGDARAVLALRSVAAFMDAPLVGVGLENAHGVQTHNAYLFFGIAYGVLGLLLIPAFALFLTYRLGATRSALPVVVFLIVSCFFSHDVLLVYGLIAAWVIALSTGSPAPAQLPGRVR
jgi:hypothetical protein